MELVEVDARVLALRAQRLERGLKRRVWREGVVGLVGLVLFALPLWMRPIGAQSIGWGLCMGGVLFAVGTLLRASARAPKVDLSAPHERALAQYQGALRFQAKLLEDVPRWYLAPFVPGTLWIFVQVGWSEGGLAWVACGVGILLAAAVFAVIAWLNLKAAKALAAEADAIGPSELA